MRDAYLIGTDLRLRAKKSRASASEGAQRGRGKNTTLLSSMTTEGMSPWLTVEGATTARIFETYVEKVLVPSLRKGQILVMDNLGAHRPKRNRKLVEQHDCE